MKSIRKQLGAINLSKQFSTLAKYRIPVGIIAVDRVAGGGIPSGKLTELYGGWSAGKTRLLLHIIVQALEAGGWAILIDTECALEAGLCDLVGLDISHEKFIYVNPDRVETIEDVFKFVEKTINTIRAEDPEGFLFVGYDSLAATPTREDLEEKEDDISVGANIAAARRAKLIGRGIRRLASKIYRTHTCFVIVNQLRDKFNVMFGDKTETPGGKAVKFHSSLRMKLQLIKKFKDKKTDEQVGNNVKLVIEKSRISRPFGVVNFEMRVDEPISRHAGLLDYMLRHGEIVKAGKKGFYVFVEEEGNETKFFKRVGFPKEYDKRQKKKS